MRKTEKHQKSPLTPLRCWSKVRRDFRSPPDPRRNKSEWRKWSILSSKIVNFSSTFDQHLPPFFVSSGVRGWRKNPPDFWSTSEGGFRKKNDFAMDLRFFAFGWNVFILSPKILVFFEKILIVCANGKIDFRKALENELGIVFVIVFAIVFFIVFVIFLIVCYFLQKPVFVIPLFNCVFVFSWSNSCC